MVALKCVVPLPRGVSKVQGGSACGPSTLWRSEVAVPVVRRCFSRVGRGVRFLIVFDSAGSAGVVFSLTWVVVEAFLCSAAL
ncbi:hypothetical protein Taro_037265 [Colocasia esculenta]|uniref:Uncharacterized protein n=1 Tax=Colocasia esculenta TaxID=4460 RepID=A0A843WCB6_COLES|nr:hypothetical protein [Colocasia esculenta]